MTRTARPLLFVCLLPLLVAAGLLATSCQDQAGKPADGDVGLVPADAIYGDGYETSSPVLVRVGDIEITQRDMDLRFEELSQQMKHRFSGDGWQTRFLHFMVDEALQYREARRRRLERDPEVARALITQQRNLMKNFLQDRAVFKDVAPTEQQIRDYYEENKRAFREEGFVHARTIVCQTREAAYKAYDAIRQAGGSGDFPRLVATYSVNLESLKQGGDLGWFKRGGHIPALPYGADFSRKVWDWEVGVHEPVEIGGQWHVVEILAHSGDRDLPLEAVRDQVVSSLEPVLQREALAAYLDGLRDDVRIEWVGSYKPGGGLTPRQLFERAWYAEQPEQRIDMLNLLVSDFPRDELADNAIYFLSHIYLDTWQDTGTAVRLLRKLIKEYPDSEFYADAQFMIEHIADVDFSEPVSPEELRQRSLKK